MPIERKAIVYLSVDTAARFSGAQIWNHEEKARYCETRAAVGGRSLHMKNWKWQRIDANGIANFVIAIAVSFWSEIRNI